MARNKTSFFISLIVILLSFFSQPCSAESKVYFAQAGHVSTLVIAQESNFARVYGLLTNGLARMHYDDATKKLDNLKFAVLMNSFVTSSPTLKREWFERRAYNPDREDEIAFVQSSSITFDNGKGILKGQLLINKSRKDAQFEATINKYGRVSDSSDLFDDGAQTLGLSLHTTLKRSDFSLVGNAENSAFNDDIILMLDIVAK